MLWDSLVVLLQLFVCNNQPMFFCLLRILILMKMMTITLKPCTFILDLNRLIVILCPNDLMQSECVMIFMCLQTICKKKYCLVLYV